MAVYTINGHHRKSAEGIFYLEALKISHLPGKQMPVNHADQLPPGSSL